MPNDFRLEQSQSKYPKMSSLIIGSRPLVASSKIKVLLCAKVPQQKPTTFIPLEKSFTLLSAGVQTSRDNWRKYFVPHFEYIPDIYVSISFWCKYIWEMVFIKCNAYFVFDFNFFREIILSKISIFPSVFDISLKNTVNSC